MIFTPRYTNTKPQKSLNFLITTWVKSSSWKSPILIINCSYSGPGHLGWRHQADKEYNNSKLRLQKIHQTSTDIS